MRRTVRSNSPAEQLREKLQVLLVQLEFSSWERGKSWSYAGNFAFEDGLVANNADCFILPALHEFPSSSSLSWLSHARELCAGKRFDQVWVWMVHNDYDEQFLEWIASLAPVRVGFLMESLDYLPEEYIQFPNLRGRRALVERQLHYMTHVLTVDEYDVTSFGGRLPVKALWYPGMLPKRYVCQQVDTPPNNFAVFSGAVYSGMRASLLTHHALKGLLAQPNLPETNTPFPRQFEELQRECAGRLQKKLPVSTSVLAEYVSRLRRIRQAIYSLWLDGIRLGCISVNLPALFKGYAGRVVESMAAGRPVISWEVPDRPRTKALFEEGREILLFPKDDPGALAAQICRVRQDPGFARYLAENARAKILRYHTAEVRMGQVLRWIETGAEPDYGEKRSSGIAESTADLVAVQSGSASSQIVVRDTESAQLARTSVEAATPSGAFCIRPDYTARSRPEYFLDQLSGVICQPDVYPIAAFFGYRLGCSHIIDIGCGHAEKLVALYPQFQIIGIDYGPNLEYCRQNYPCGQWIELNLETDSTIPIDPATLRRSIIICADVIEHLIDPTKLLHTIRSLADHAPVAIITTPERDLTHGAAHLGPPPNPCHVREWNLEELGQLLRAEHLNVLFLGLTVNNNLERSKKNSIALIGNNHSVPTGAVVNAIETVAARWLDRPPQRSFARYSAEQMAEPAATRVVQTVAADHIWPTQVSGYVQQAEAHFVRGDLPAARDTLSKALALVPDDAQLLIAHANIVLRLGDTDGALREFAQAAALAPDSAPAHLNLAAVLLMRGRTAEAETSVRQALALSQDDAEALKLLGRICFEAGRHVEGATAYTEALRNNPNDVESLLVLGKWAFEMGDRVTAQRMYEHALQIDPNNQVARESLGLLKAQAAGTVGAEQLPVTKKAPGGSWQPTDRLRLLLVVHGFPPKSAAGTELYAYTLAQELRRRGHVVRVLCPEYGSNHAEGTITNDVYEGLDVARIHVKCGDFISQFKNERLLPALRRYLADLSVDLVHIQHLIGMSASALQVFVEKGIPIMMTVHDGWLICEQCHFLQPDGTYCKDGPETVDKCVHCLVGRYGLSCQSERTPEIFYALALRRQFLQKMAGSIDTFIVPSQFMREKLARHGFEHPRMALSPLGLPTFQPLSWQPRADRLRFTFLGNICFTKGLDLAIRAFNLVDQTKARLDLYGRVQDAAYFNQAMSSVRPGHQVKYHGPYGPADLPTILAGTDVAVITSRSEHYPCIVREALQAGVPIIAPNVGGVPEILQDGEGGLLFKLGDYEDLATKLRFFVNDPSQVATFRQHIRPMRTIGEDADQLEAIYRDALARRSDVGEVQVAAAPSSVPPGLTAWLRRADEYALKGEWAAVHDALKAALDRAPNDPQIIVALGNIKLRLGDVEAARLEFTRAAALIPEYSPAFSNLAAVLLHLGRLEEAGAAARRAVSINPGDTDALKVLARVCLDSERYTEAVQAYVTILRHTPDDIETLLTVANCYAEAGRPEDAKTFYQRVLQLDPGNAVAAENLAIINGSAPPIAHAPTASIVIVTYNSASTIRTCLESVLQCTQPSTELIVVDNGSTDETRAMLDEYQGRITLILNAENKGFSGACNQGICASSGQYVVLLNPDTVVTSGWLDRLIAHFKPDVGAVGPVSDYVAGLQKMGLYLPEQMPQGLSLAEAGELLGRVNADKAVETKLLIGFCMVLSRKVLDEVGLLDEELFLGNDDLDLSWRLRQRGYRLLVATDAFVHHEGQVSFKSEPSATTARLVQDSTDRLYAKLETRYGKGNVPDPMELWGITWFKPTAPHFRSKTPDAEQGLTSIIILTHNGLEHTEKCLTSIAVHTPEPHELIIVDNGSTDGTLAYLRNYMASHVNVRVIANRSNRGFAAGNNQGMALARGEYVLLLNNDTIVTEGWLRRMVAVFHRHPEVGVVGPMSNYVSGPQLVKGVSYANPEELARFSARWAAEHAAQSVPITRVVGFCLLARQQVIERIGGLDEQFGSGNFEDDDLCIRAAQVGYAARIAHDVFIHHTGSQTFRAAGINYRKSLLRNWELFKTKWGIPADAPYEQGYRVPLQPPPGLRLHVPLPDLSADYRAEAEGRWWQEVSKVAATASRAGSAAEPLSAVIVSNGHGLAPLWASLVQHTNHPLAITILPSTGNGHGSDPIDRPACPEGWRVRTGDLPDVRLLNQLLASAHDDPMIVLSSNLILTPGWLKRLLAALRRDQRLAAVGPTSNQGDTPQRVKAEYKGTGKALRQFALRRAHRHGEELAEVDSLAPFCIVFKPSACRPIGSLREDLDLLASLRDYVARLRQAGCTVGVALDAYVHCEPPGPPS